MLVLSRQKDESIIIGDDVEIVIVDVRGDKVKLGITAPKGITVHRKEIYEAIQIEKGKQAKNLQTLKDESSLKLQEIKKASPQTKSFIDKILKR